MNWLARVALDSPRSTLLVAGLVTAVLAIGLLRLELRTDGAALRPSGNPVVENSERDEARFRDPTALLLIVSARSDQASLATPEGFRFLRDLHERLERLPALRPAGLMSIASLPRLREGIAGVSIGRYLDEVPDDPLRFGELLAELRARPVTDGLLLSADGRRALFSLPISEKVSAPDAVRALERFCEVSAHPDYELLLGGPIAAETLLGTRVLRDLAVLVPLMLVVITVLLYAMLGTLGGVMIPMLETLIVLIWTLGAMGWTGTPIALVTTILPVVLMAMCITDEIHLLERLAGNWKLPRLRARIDAALSEVGRPIILTSLTTALGFLSFTSASVPPLRDFGVFAAFGILSAMLLTFSFVPAVITLLPERFLRPPDRSVGRNQLARYARFASTRPGVCFGIGALALAASLPGARLLEVSDSWVENFDARDGVVQAERSINESFWGSYRFDLVFEGEPGYFHDPPGASLMEAVRAASLSAPHVGGVVTYLTPLDEIAAALGETDGVTSLPAEKLWDVLTLAEMSESRAGLAELLTGNGDAARARLYVKSPDYVRGQELARYFDELLPSLIPKGDVTAHFSGDLPMASALVESIVDNQLRGVAWALLTVGVLLVVFSRRLGELLALVPVLATILALFGWMGYLDLSLGIATSMFASLTVGVGVDFGIHFLHHYRRQRAAGAGEAAAIENTFLTAGRALMWNSVVLAAGFLALVASSLKPNHSLGLLLAASTLACFAASFLLLPLLLRVRPSRAASGALLLTIGSLCLAAPLRAEDDPCAGRSRRGDDPVAMRVMAALEKSVRETPRLFRMELATDYSHNTRLRDHFRGIPNKIIWVVVNGDANATSMLFVFSGPGRMAGTTLLIVDAIDPGVADEIWFYLRAFEHFEKLGAGAERAVVPGSALSYQDARGYIAVDQYRFERLGDGGGSAQTMQVLACPRSAEIAEAHGYGAIEIDVDTENLIARKILYRGRGGAPLKSYQLLETAQLGGRAFPARVRLEHHRDGFGNDVLYEYWPVTNDPGSELFRADLEAGTFLSRMRRMVERNGQGARLKAELDQADERVRQYEERAERPPAPVRPR